MDNLQQPTFILSPIFRGSELPIRFTVYSNQSAGILFPFEEKTEVTFQCCRQISPNTVNEDYFFQKDNIGESPTLSLLDDNSGFEFTLEATDTENLGAGTYYFIITIDTTGNSSDPKGIYKFYGVMPLI